MIKFAFLTKLCLYFNMDYKEIKGVCHYIFENISELKALGPSKIGIVPHVVEDWRKANEKEWVYTDDKCVVQVMKKFSMPNNVGKKEYYVRTLCGTYKIAKNSKILGENGIADSINTIGGKMPEYRDDTGKAFLFARYVAEGFDKAEAYKKAYPNANDKYYINKRSTQLLKSEKVQKMIKEEIQQVLSEVGVTPNWIVERYKTIADLADKDSDKLRSLESLSKIAGLYEQNEKKSEQLTVWAGFSPEQMEAIQDGKNTKLLAHQEKEKK